MSFNTGGGGSCGGLRDAGSITNSAGRKRYEESSYEKTVRKNIQEIRANLQQSEEHLENLNKRLVSRRIVETLHDHLKVTYEIVLQTEHILRDWEIHLAGDPFEKHRRKFSFEKLKAHFEAEVDRVKEISDRVQAAATRVAEDNAGGSSTTTRPSTAASGSDAAGGLSSGFEDPSVDEPPQSRDDFETGVDFLYDDFMDGEDELPREEGNIVLIEDGPLNKGSEVNKDEHKGGVRLGGLGDRSNRAEFGGSRQLKTGSRGVNRELTVASASSSPDRWNPLPCVATAQPRDYSMQATIDMEEPSEKESLIQRHVAEDRLRGIKRIQHQVSQANQIFRDLASLVLHQDSHLETINSSMQNVNEHTKGAANELRKAYIMQRNARKRRCMMLLLVFVLVAIVFYTFIIPHLHAVHHPAELLPPTDVKEHPKDGHNAS